MPSSPSKILIVEDSPMMQKMYRAALGGEGAPELIFAENGAEGLDRAAQEMDIDLFIVDINMPRMDGLEFLRRLRGELKVGDVPAIVVSTEGGDADRRAAREAGADGYLHKPWTPPDLAAAIENLEREGA